MTQYEVKDGGYLANDRSADVSLATLYKHFVLEKEHHTRLFTGDEGSHCQIARNIATTMSHYQQDEQNIIINFYKEKQSKMSLKHSKGGFMSRKHMI